MGEFRVGDLTVGLALFVDPDVLLAEGASYTGEETARIQGRHYFLCLECGDSEGRWLPLFSTHRFDRQELVAAKTGHAGWTDKTSYFDPDQLWTVSHRAILHAARVAGDGSHPWEPNRADPVALPDLWWLAGEP